MTKRRERTLDDVIHSALERELERMQDHDGLISAWAGAPLASWIAPGVIRSVKRHLTLTLKPKGKKK